jgi:predicted  nucleic acid-binding Zn-ribbon protein
MEKIPEKFKQALRELKKEIHGERKKIGKIEDLIKKEAERGPGIWEYDFDELESEIWKKHASIEKKIKELSEKISDCSGKGPRNIFRFFRNLRGNIIRQNVINQEVISFYLAMMLSLQKIKDRINALEYKVSKLNREKDELISDMQEYKSGLRKKQDGEAGE